MGGDVSEDQNETNAANPPEYVGVEGAAELLCTTTKAVYTMNDRGALPGVRRIGRRLLVNRAELVAWIESCGPSSRRTR